MIDNNRLVIPDSHLPAPATTLDHLDMAHRIRIAKPHLRHGADRAIAFQRERLQRGNALALERTRG